LASSIDGVLDKGNNDIFSKNWTPNDGQAFLIYQTSEHIITENRIENNTQAINTYDGEGLEIYNNNFINNQKNVATMSDAFSAPLGGGGGTLPPWDNGKEGNYWSNYDGADANRDGIGDTAYVVRSDIYTVDRYPLSEPLDIREPSIKTTSMSNSLSLGTSPSPLSNGNPNSESISNSTILSQTPQKNTGRLNQQQTILILVATALAGYFIVLIAIATFRDKNQASQT
jgi:hypothetical protein